MSYEPPSLAPLTITPDMAAMAQRNASQQPAPLTASDFAEAPVAEPPSSGPDPGVDQLAEMFPDYDKDVIASVLTMCGNSVDSAMEQLLEMGGGGGGGGGGPAPSESGMDADEELAMALFHQFASEMEEQMRKEKRTIDPAIKADPQRYQEFVMANASRGGELERRVQAAFGSSGSGSSSASGNPSNQKSFLERFKRGDLFSRKAAPIMGTSTRVKVVAVGSGAGSSGARNDDKRVGLLADQDRFDAI